MRLTKGFVVWLLCAVNVSFGSTSDDLLVSKIQGCWVSSASSEIATMIVGGRKASIQILGGKSRDPRRSLFIGRIGPGLSIPFYYENSSDMGFSCKLEGAASETRLLCEWPYGPVQRTFKPSPCPSNGHPN
jgi:hypothetical protein